jgi:hypothetical protein
LVVHHAYNLICKLGNYIKIGFFSQEKKMFPESCPVQPFKALSSEDPDAVAPADPAEKD